MSSSHKPDTGLEELKIFIEAAKLDASALAELNAETKRFYRKFYALLVFDYLLQGNLVEDDKKNYAREAVSDISHAFFLTCIGLYKPALTSARSSIENFIRFMLLCREIDAKSITAVYSLFEETNSMFAKSYSQKKRIGELRRLYSELCKTVHSTSSDYMNLEVPFNTMLTFDNSKFKTNRDIVHDICKVSVELLFIEFNDFVQSSHHSLQDILSDSVAKSVRQEARELREGG